MPLLSTVAEFEIEAGARARQKKAGIASAKARGAYNGRKPLGKAKIKQVTNLVVSGLPVSKACQEVGIGRTTYYNHR